MAVRVKRHELELIFPASVVTEPGINPLWPSETAWGVPLLRLDRQALSVPLPISRWGRETRKSRMCGTWHFYTDDYRFETLWSKPYQVARSGCAAAIECNFSVHGQTARARALWQTYRKRWLARYWQEAGINVLVDLNVAEEHSELNMLGVPQGWSTWATRGSRSDTPLLDAQYARAKAHGNGSVNVFLVYGGGRRVGLWCEYMGASWVREEQDKVSHG